MNELTMCSGNKTKASWFYDSETGKDSGVVKWISLNEIAEEVFPEIEWTTKLLTNNRDVFKTIAELFKKQDEKYEDKTSLVYSRDKIRCGPLLVGYTQMDHPHHVLGFCAEKVIFVIDSKIDKEAMKAIFDVYRYGDNIIFMLEG